MKQLLHKLMVVVGLGLLVACSAPVAQEESIGSQGASSNTQSKTNVKNWNLSALGASVKVKGLSADGKVLQSLEAIRNSDGSGTAIKTYLDSAGNTVRNDTFVINSQKQLTVKPSTATDASLCPECMATDLAVLDTSSLSVSIKVHAQVTPACIKARNRVAKFSAQISQYCVVGGDAIACANAYSAFLDALGDAVSSCG